MDLTPGTLVNTNVRLVRPLGEGAMGTVWVADHLTLATQVAVKFISSEIAHKNPEIVARFEREASVAAKLRSPHVVQTFDRGVTEDGTPYIVMELLDGESLQRRLERAGTLTLEETTVVVTQVGRALRRAHEAGIVHRDIKPDNVFVVQNDEEMFCKVLDFGIAKQAQLPQMGGLTNPGVMVGTPEFMSPEQLLSSKDVDHHADLWALSVTAYYCLSGKLPFTAEALGALCIVLLKGEFLPPSVHCPELAPEVDAFFKRALAREASARFQDARSLSLAFAALLPSGAPFEDTLSLHGARNAPGRLATIVGAVAPADPMSADAGDWDEELARAEATAARATTDQSAPLPPSSRRGANGGSERGGGVATGSDAARAHGASPRSLTDVAQPSGTLMAAAATQPPAPPPAQRGPAGKLGLAAALVLVAVGGAMLVFRGPEEAPAAAKQEAQTRPGRLSGPGANGARDERPSGELEGRPSSDHSLLGAAKAAKDDAEQADAGQADAGSEPADAAAEPGAARHAAQETGASHAPSTAGQATTAPTATAVTAGAAATAAAQAPPSKKSPTQPAGPTKRGEYGF